MYIQGIRGAGENIWSLWSVHFQDYSPSCVPPSSASCFPMPSSDTPRLSLQELVTMLNGVDVRNFLTLRTFVMKVIGATAAVAASLPLGYQGVMLHIGAMLATILGQLLPYFELSRGAKRAPSLKGKPRPSHCMPLVRSSANFEEYSGQALPASTKWSVRLPRLVKRIKRCLSSAFGFLLTLPH
jgi:hypothetical protein